MKNSKKICLIEDSKIVSDLLKFTVERNIDCVVYSIDLNRTIEHIMEVQPNVIILDYSLDQNEAELNSTMLLEHFSKEIPDVPIIIFSGQTNLSIAAELLVKGAIDYISKNSSTFHDDIILSVKKALEFTELTKKKKSHLKRNHKQLLKILSLSFIMFSLISYVLMK